MPIRDQIEIALNRIKDEKALKIILTILNRMYLTGKPE
jgi:hypothetical protein